MKEETKVLEKYLDLYDELLKIQKEHLEALYCNTFSHLDETTLKELYMTYYAKCFMEPSFVYFIYNKYTKLIKIGKAKNPFKRLNELNSMFKNHFGVENALEMLRVVFIQFDDGYAAEKIYHKTYKEYRTFGEWFNIDKSVILEDIPEFLNYDTDNLLENEGLNEKIEFKDIDEHTLSVFALDTLDDYTKKLSGDDNNANTFLKKTIHDEINTTYGKEYRCFFNLDIRHMGEPFSSNTDNKTWEMFKWLYLNKDKYCLSTMYHLDDNDNFAKRVIGFNRNTEILDFNKIVYDMADKICYINTTE